MYKFKVLRTLRRARVPLGSYGALTSIPGESKLTLGEHKIQPRWLLEALEHDFGYPKAAFWGVGSPFRASWEVLECPKSAPRAPQGCQTAPQGNPKRPWGVQKSMKKTTKLTSQI